MQAHSPKKAETTTSKIHLVELIHVHVRVAFLTLDYVNTVVSLCYFILS